MSLWSQITVDVKAYTKHILAPNKAHYLHKSILYFPVNTCKSKRTGGKDIGPTSHSIDLLP